MARFNLKKHTAFLVMLGILSSIFIPFMSYTLIKVAPYLNLLPVLEDPEAMTLNNMAIIDRKYNFTIETQFSQSSNAINVDRPIWDIEGIYLEEEYPSDSRTNYFNSGTFINEHSIALSSLMLPNYTYINEFQQSTYIVINEDDIYNISQSEDDAWNRETPIPRTNSTSSSLLLGGHNSQTDTRQRRICLRWNLPIPKNAKIIEAYINLTLSTSNNYGGFNCYIYAFNEDSTPSFEDIDENIRLRSLTPAVNWILPTSIVINESIQSPDITSILQQIVIRENWSEANNFGLLIKPYQLVAAASNEMTEFWSFDAGILKYVPKLIIHWEEPPVTTYDPIVNPNVRQEVNTDHNIIKVNGVWNTSEHLFENLYNESNGDTFLDNKIFFSTPFSQGETYIYISYVSDQVPLMVEYYYKPWESIMWRLDLKVTNTGGSTITVPRANLSINHLGGQLGYGWISTDSIISAGKSEIVQAFVIMNNDRLFQSFLIAALLGEPLDLKTDFEAYILIDDISQKIPLFGVIYPTELSFPFPSSKGGSPPYIWSINRTSVRADQPVNIFINATDQGTGISNRTYIYYSIDNGNSWNNATMTGGTWVNSFLGTPLGGYFPIPSTIYPESYQGQIPGFSAGTEVLFKIYLEDYAGNVEHTKKANFVESQIFSYTVPIVGELSPEFNIFYKEEDVDFFATFFDYLEASGVNLLNYMFLEEDLNSLTILPLLGGMTDFFYAHDVDSDYAIGLLLIALEYGLSIMGDSGLAAGHLLDLLEVDFENLINYLVDHVFLPTSEDLPTLAQEKLQEIFIIDDMDGNITNHWISSASGIVDEELFNILSINSENIGFKSMNWTLSTLGNLTRNFGSETFSLTENDILTIHLDYEEKFYNRINGNISIEFFDENSYLMKSKTLNFENSLFGTWQEILLFLNSTDFSTDPGFDFSKVQKISVDYNGTKNVSIFLDYICTYSPQVYDSHYYFTQTLKLKNSDIRNFLNLKFQGIGRVELLGEYDHIIPLEDWDLNYSRISLWNFLNLIASGNETNNHITAANLLLEDMGIPGFYNRLLLNLEGEILLANTPITPNNIYPYTQTITSILVFTILGLVVYKVVKRELYTKKELKKLSKAKNVLIKKR